MRKVLAVVFGDIGIAQVDRLLTMSGKVTGQLVGEFAEALWGSIRIARCTPWLRCK